MLHVLPPSFPTRRSSDPGDGTGPTPFNAEGGVRVSPASAELGADVLRRPNLTILANMAVRHIVFEERRAVAIATESGAIFKGAMIVASAGAIHSPTLLLRSGIGPAEELARAGIAPIADRRGVGRNLVNHPFLIVSSYIRKPGRQRDRSEEHTSELQSLMPISYAVFCLKNKN